MSDAGTSNSRERSLLSRRSVLGTVAWSVPAITLATAAPALAASGDRITLGTATASWSGLLGVVLPTLSASLPITLATTHSSSATGLTIVVNFGATPSQALAPNAMAGWTITPAPGSSSKATQYTFTKTANTAAGTTTFSPSWGGVVLSLGYPLPQGTSVTFTVSAGSTVATPPPATFTNTGQVGGLTQVSAATSTTN